MRTRLFVLAASLTLTGLLAPPANASSGTTYTWVGSSQDAHADNHSWTDSRNWNPQGVPGDGDSVVIVQPNPTHCTAHVDAVPTVTLEDFTLTQKPDLCGTSVNGGRITVTGSFSWDGGSLATPTTIAAGALGAITGANGKLNGLAADLDLQGTLAMTGVTGPAAMRIINPFVLHVEHGATLHALGTNDVTFLSCCNNPARVINDGTLTLEGGTFHVDAVALDQNGTVSATGGGRLLTTSAPVTADGGATYDGSGGWSLEDGAHARFTGTQTLGPDFHLELGGLTVPADSTLAGTATLAGTGTLDWTGGTIEANLTIAHGFHVQASGVHVNNGRRVLRGWDTTVQPAVPTTVTNHGQVVLDQGAALDTAATALLVNASDGLVSLAPGTRMASGACCVSPDRIVNQGSLVVPAGATGDPVVLTNVAYQAHGGSTSIAPDRVLQLAGHAPNELAATTVTGGGTLTLTAPTTVSDEVTTGTATEVDLQPGGSLEGSATIGGAGSLAWTGGVMGGVLEVGVSGGVTVSGTDLKTVGTAPDGGASHLTLGSATTFAAGTSAARNLVELGNATLSLTSTTTLRDHAEIHGGALFNTGALTVDPGASGRFDVSGSGSVVNRGTLTVKSGSLVVAGDFTQSAGRTSLAGGAHLDRTSTGQALDFGGGVLEGRGVLGAGVVNTGATVRPGGSAVGTLRILGGYTQGSHGVLAVDLGAGGRDLLSVAGAGALGGILHAHDLAGYQPERGSRYTVLRAGSLHDSLGCATTSGTGSTGTRAGHWASATSGGALRLTWTRGAVTRC